jgi:AraC family transcriptional regulator
MRVEAPKTAIGATGQVGGGIMPFLNLAPIGELVGAIPTSGTLGLPPAREGRAFATAEPDGAWRLAVKPGHRGIQVDNECQKTWTGLSAVVQDIRADGPVEIDSTTSYDRLVVVLEETGAGFRVRSSDPDEAGLLDQPNRMYFIPAGATSWWSASAAASLRHLTLQFTKLGLAALAGARGVLQLPEVCKIGFSDRRLLALARLIEAECDRDDVSDSLLGDALSISLLSLLSIAPRGRSRAVYAGGLTGRQLKLVTDYMETNLADRIASETCADLVRLSPSHFHRAFKVSTGKPPHAWLTEARVRRARELLATSDRRLADIALETGFSDQPHFTRVFSRVVGQSPGAWRRGADL